MGGDISLPSPPSKSTPMATTTEGVVSPWLVYCKSYLSLPSSQNVPENPDWQKHLQQPLSASPALPPLWQQISEQSAEIQKDSIIPVKNLSSQLPDSKLRWNLTASSLLQHTQRRWSHSCDLLVSESSVSLHLPPWACCDLFVRSTIELSKLW